MYINSCISLFLNDEWSNGDKLDATLNQTPRCKRFSSIFDDNGDGLIELDEHGIQGHAVSTGWMWHEPHKASCSQWLGLRSLGVCPLDNFEHMNRCWFGLHIACAHYANIVNGLRVESASKYSQKCRSDELYRSEGRPNFMSPFSVKQSSTPHSHKTVEASRGLWTFPASWLSWHSCIARRSRAIKPYGYVMGFWGWMNLRHTHPH